MKRLPSWSRVASQHHGGEVQVMGTRKSSFIGYFLCFFLINVHSVYCQGVKNSTCQNGCPVTVPSLRLSCRNINNSDCPVVGTAPVSSLSSSSSDWFLTDVAVNESAADSNYAFHLVWTLPSGPEQEQLERFQRLVQSETASSPSCTVYHPPRASTTSSQNVVFVDDCSEDINAGTRYTVTITSLPSHTSTQYYIQTANNLVSTLVADKLSSWQSTLCLSVGPILSTDAGDGGLVYRTLQAVFQPPPPNLKVTSYDLQFSSPHVYSCEVLPPEKSCNITVPVGATYNATLIVFGESCPDGCHAAFLSSIVVTDDVASVTSSASQKSSTASSTSSRSSASPTTAASSPTTKVTPTMAAHSTEDPSVVIEPSDDGEKYHEKIKIISGVVAGAVLLILVALIIFCVIRRKRASPRGNFSMQRFGTVYDSEDDIALEDAYKQPPSVLLVYSYDCEAHEQVVVEFASYLRHAANCSVSLDIWQQNEINKCGAIQWVKHKLQQCQFVIVICSTGARFKCVRNQQFRMKQSRPIQDFFTLTVDHIAERMHSTAAVGDSLSQFLVVYFDYAGPSDIPPKLDRAKKYCLMRDIYPLYCHLYDLDGEGEPQSKHIGLTADTYTHEDTGRQLYEALENAHLFFQENPEWLGKVLEPISPPQQAPQTNPANSTAPPQTLVKPEGENSNGGSDSSQKVSVDGGNQGGDSSTSPSVNSEQEALLEQRKKKRRGESEDFEMKPRTDSVFGSKRDKPSPLKPLPPYHKGAPHDSKAPDVGTTRHSYANPLYMNGLSQPPEAEDVYVDDDAQLRKDIDFIQNYDIHHQWDSRSPQPADVLINFDFTGGHTPPENFVTPLGGASLWPGVAPAPQGPPPDTMINGSLPNSITLNLDHNSLHNTSITTDSIRL